MKHLLQILFFMSLSISVCFSQFLVEYNELGFYTKENLENQLNYDAFYDVRVYKVLYNTPDLNGNQHVASGIVCVPQTNNEMPLLCYQHGTVGDRTEVPSNLMGGYTGGVAFAMQGYLAVMPDYLGLGDSPGLHPYIHAESEAWVAVDLLRAAKEMQEDLSFTINDQLFVTGYSQGGHSSMALQKMVEQNQDLGLTITAGGHMSGPYSVSEKMIEFTLSDEPYLFVAYLAWVALSVKETYPDLLANYALENIFKEQFIEPIESFKNEEQNLWDLNIRLIQLIITTEDPNIIPKAMLHDSIVDALHNDPTHPLSMALQRNDLHNWVPMQPTRMFYCTADDQVTFKNAVFADSTMNAAGAPDVLAVDVAPSQDHGGCVRPATIATLEFFRQYSGLTSHTLSPLATCDIEITQQNEHLIIDAPCKNESVQILSLDGRVLFNSLQSDIKKINVNPFNSGLYVLQIKLEDQSIITQKVWIQ